MHIPFERTISGGYSFGFTRILSVIGIAWFPMVLMVGITGGLLYLLMPAFMDFLHNLPQPGQQPDPMRLAGLFRAMALLYGAIVPAFFILSAMMRIGVMRKALGLMKGPTFIFFSLGGQVWRLLGAYLMIGIGIAVYYFVSVVLCGIVFAILLAAASKVIAGVAMGIVGVALFCLGVYLFLRISFFLPAAIVAEDLFGFGRSWELSSGNFWRIFGVLLIVYLPIYFVVGILNQTFLSATLLPQIMQHAGQHPTPAEAQAIVREVMGTFVRFVPYFVGVYVVQTILLLGIDAGAVATAYRAVTGTESKA
jgi:hypothetical protein